MELIHISFSLVYSYFTLNSIRCSDIKPSSRNVRKMSSLDENITPVHSRRLKQPYSPQIRHPKARRITEAVVSVRMPQVQQAEEPVPRINPFVDIYENIKRNIKFLSVGLLICFLMALACFIGFFVDKHSVKSCVRIISLMLLFMIIIRMSCKEISA